ncbi:MAG: septal ring lytic transglycosylase RlpA family protein, partial [Alphaproteobacteria bacterium]
MSSEGVHSPRPLSRRLRVAAVVVGGLFLAGCAETELAIHAAKQAKSRQGGEAGAYKVGKPYKIDSVWYYPKVDYDYVETGIASWYGDPFHGRETANGETYDMNALTAAHRTLPLPSIVRVTNLGNGRAITVRVNDRGPFAHGRIIDMSRRSAQLLGFARQGTAKVRVDILPDESRMAAGEAQGRAGVASLPASPRGAVRSETLAPPPGS